MLYTKGNPEKILSLCSNVSAEETAHIQRLMEGFQDKAGRLLAFAHKELACFNGEKQQELEQDLHYDGFVVISDPLSPDVYDSIRDCRRARHRSENADRRQYPDSPVPSLRNSIC